MGDSSKRPDFPQFDPSLDMTRERAEEAGIEVFEVVGSIKWFDASKGYGFIVPEGQDGSEVYVHFSAIESSGFRTLHEGERVEFETVSSTRGTEATHVLKV